MIFPNLADALTHHARRRPDHPALIHGEHRLDYAALDRRVRGLAAHLADRGLQAGDIVGVSLADTIEHPVALWAVIRLGAVVLPLDVRWTPEEKSRVATHFEARAVLVEKDAEPVEGSKTLRLDETAALEGGENRTFPGRHDDPVVLSLSSGTTGTPKGPVLTHRQMGLRFASQWVSLGFNERDRFMCSTPLYFGGGRNFTLSNLYTGATVVLYPPPYRAQELVDAVNAHDITSLFLVPTLLRRVLALPPRDGLLMPAVQRLISSGSLLHADERAAVMARLTPNFYNAYSSTEGGSIAVLPPDAGPELAGSVGRAFFMNEFEVVDADGRVLPPGEVGAIRQRAPWLPEGFHRNPEETARYFREGWYYPGDLGRIDAQGHLYIVGRTKDMIIRGGVNIYPAEIEETLLAHPDVRDAAVVAWPCRQFGEEVAAFVAATDEADPEAMRAWCRERLASYKVPRRVFVRDELPKNSSGKVLKASLAESLPPIDEA